jgi:nicotinamidase-related amidase
MAKKQLFLDIDTQFDFLSRKGKLYVPNAETIVDKISQTRKFALDNGFSILASVDWHSLDDAEISLQPDNKKTFPPHCLAGQPGSERVGFLGDVPIEYAQLEKMKKLQLKKLVDKPQFHVVVRTNTVDMFENPNTLYLLSVIGPKTIVVFGVALDVCVRNAVEGLLRWGKCSVILLKDVTKGLGIIKEKALLTDFAERGVQIKTLAELKREF